MSIWLVVWLLLVVIFAGFVIWTSLILMRQKSAWRDYATKRKLRYNPGGLMQSPDVQGVVGDHRVTIFTSEHSHESMRTSRKMTAIEVNLNSEMPIAGGAASGEMIEILKGMALKQEFVPKHEDWTKAYVCMADSRQVMERYLNDDRLEALTKLMRRKHTMVILAFREDKMLLRIDTADPFDSAAAVDKVVKAMLSVAVVLELGSGESKVLKSDAVRLEAEAISLEVDEEVMGASALQLEDENDAASDEIEKPKGANS